MNLQLKYKEDRRSIGFVIFTLLLLLLPFVYAPSGIWAAPYIFTTTIFCFSCCVINHNHTHCSTFRSKPANRIFDFLLTLAKGHTTKTVIVPHIMNHHKHSGTKKDWIRMEIAGRGIGLIRFLRYVVHAIYSMHLERRKDASPRLPKTLRKEQNQEQLLLLLFCIALIFTNIQVFMAYILLPWLLAMFILVAINLLQHDGCAPESQFDHSRNFTGKLGNWLFFNNGYHTIHHIKPSLHWSLAPGEHIKRVEPYISKSLIQDSILLFLLRHYIFGFSPPVIGKVQP